MTAQQDEEQIAAELRDLFDAIDPPPPTDLAHRLWLYRTRISPVVHAYPRTGAADHPAPARPLRFDPAAAGHQTASRTTPPVAVLLAPKTAGRAVAAPALPANAGDATDHAVGVGVHPGPGAALPAPHTSGEDGVTTPTVVPPDHQNPALSSGGADEAGKASAAASAVPVDRAGPAGWAGPARALRRGVRVAGWVLAGAVLLGLAAALGAGSAGIWLLYLS